MWEPLLLSWAKPGPHVAQMKCLWCFLDLRIAKTVAAAGGRGEKGEEECVCVGVSLSREGKTAFLLWGLKKSLTASPRCGLPPPRFRAGRRLGVSWGATTPAALVAASMPHSCFVKSWSCFWLWLWRSVAFSAHSGANSMQWDRKKSVTGYDSIVTGCLGLFCQTARSEVVCDVLHAVAKCWFLFVCQEFRIKRITLKGVLISWPGIVAILPEAHVCGILFLSLSFRSLQVAL